MHGKFCSLCLRNWQISRKSLSSCRPFPEYKFLSAVKINLISHKERLSLFVPAGRMLWEGCGGSVLDEALIWLLWLMFDEGGDRLSLGFRCVFSCSSVRNKNMSVESRPLMLVCALLQESYEGAYFFLVPTRRKKVKIYTWLFIFGTHTRSGKLEFLLQMFQSAHSAHSSDVPFRRQKAPHHKNSYIKRFYT